MAMASERTQCNCEKCKTCCLGIPGWFMPGEAEKAAEAMGLTFLDFFDTYCIVEYWMGEGGHDIHVLSPRKEGQMTARAEWGDNFRRAPCHLLTHQGCKLSAEVRPWECATTLSCTAGKNTNQREKISEAWDTPDIQQQLAEFALRTIREHR